MFVQLEVKQFLKTNMLLNTEPGFIAIGRVDGDLAVSRALGDFHFKGQDDLSQQDQKVRAVASFEGSQL